MINKYDFENMELEFKKQLFFSNFCEPFGSFMIDLNETEIDYFFQTFNLSFNYPNNIQNILYNVLPLYFYYENKDPKLFFNKIFSFLENYKTMNDEHIILLDNLYNHLNNKYTENYVLIQNKKKNNLKPYFFIFLELHKYLKKDNTFLFANISRKTVHSMCGDDINQEIRYYNSEVFYNFEEGSKTQNIFNSINEKFILNNVVVKQKNNIKKSKELKI